MIGRGELFIQLLNKNIEMFHAHKITKKNVYFQNKI
jgi:hypothetical protein